MPNRSISIRYRAQRDHFGISIIAKWISVPKLHIWFLCNYQAELTLFIPLSLTSSSSLHGTVEINDLRHSET